jgi:hypothetical protein
LFCCKFNQTFQVAPGLSQLFSALCCIAEKGTLFATAKVGSSKMCRKPEMENLRYNEMDTFYLSSTVPDYHFASVSEYILTDSS